MKRSRRWIIAIAVVVLLAAAALWYTRPLTLTELLGAEPARIHVVISRFDQAGGSQTRELNADWDQAPEATALAEELTVRRSLLNPLRSLLNPVQFGTPTQAGDYNYLLSLQWFVDQWSYETPGTSRYLPCSVSASRSGGELGDALWELSQPVESNS